MKCCAWVLVFGLAYAFPARACDKRLPANTGLRASDSPFVAKCNSVFDPGANEEIVPGKIYRVRSRAWSNFTGPNPPLDTPIYVIRSEARRVVVFSLGQGDRSTASAPSNMSIYTTAPFNALFLPIPFRMDALKTSQADAANLQRVIEDKDCLNMPVWEGNSVFRPVDLDFIVPHAHVDHVNVALLSAVKKLGGNPARVIYHREDHEALHCTSPWCGKWKDGMDPELKKKSPYNQFAFAPFAPSFVDVGTKLKVALDDPQGPAQNHCAIPLLSLPYDGEAGGIQVFRSSDPRQAAADGLKWTRDYAFVGGLENPPFHTPGALTLYLPGERAFDELQQCQGKSCTGLVLLGADPSEQNCFWPARQRLDSTGKNITRRRGFNGDDQPVAPYFNAKALGQHIITDDTVR